MKTVALSTRLSKEEAKKVAFLAQELGLERSALLKQMIHQQVGQLLVKQACERYRERAISISKAAEEADLS